MEDLSEVVHESGFEADRLGPAGRLGAGPGDIRWWFYVYVPGYKLRNQRARLGVMDRGFRFARGGRATSHEEAQSRIREAAEVANYEARYWAGQPSHALGPAGELIPLDEIIPELTA